MREILFRAKRIGDGKWIEGDLIKRVHYDEVTYYIGFIEMTSLSKAQVIPETVSQFTGLYDKNGARIWENDIVIIGGNKSFPTMIEFLSGSWQCVRKYTDKGRENEYSYLHRLEYDNLNQYEVIGNRFDNPELLRF